MCELAILISYRNDDSGLCCPSGKELSRKWSGARTYHSRIVNELAEIGVITIGKARAENGFFFNTYDFNFSLDVDYTMVSRGVLNTVANGRISKNDFKMYTKMLREADNNTKTLRGNKTELAAQLNTSRPTLNRILKKLTSANMVKVKRNAEYRAITVEVKARYEPPKKKIIII